MKDKRTIYIANFGADDSGKRLEEQLKPLGFNVIINDCNAHLAKQQIQMWRPTMVVVIGNGMPEQYKFSENDVASYAASLGMPVLLNAQRTKVETEQLKNIEILEDFGKVAAGKVAAKVGDMVANLGKSSRTYE